MARRLRDHSRRGSVGKGAQTETSMLQDQITRIARVVCAGAFIALFLGLLFSGMWLWAGSPAQKEGVVEGYRIIRCQFAEKRIVVKKGDRILVLSEKDQLPGTAVRVDSIRKNQAILEKHDRSGRKEYILVEEKDGAPFIRVLKNSSETQPVFPATSSPIIVPQTSETEKKN